MTSSNRHCALLFAGLVIGCNDAATQDDAAGGASVGGESAIGGDATIGGSSSSQTSPTGGGGGGAVDPGKVPVFIAQGSVGRTTMSCDDGHTWVANHQWDSAADELMCATEQNAICYQSTCSYSVDGECIQAECCNDTPDVAKGVIYGHPVFYLTFGYAEPSSECPLL